MIIGLHLALLVGFSFRFQLLHTGLIPILTFFVLTFCDRLNSRPFRSLALDFVFLEQKKYTLLKQGVLRRTLLISFLLCAMSVYLLSLQRSWSSIPQLALLTIIVNSMISNSLICSRSIRHQGIHLFLYTQSISLVFLFFNTLFTFKIFLLLQLASFLLGLFAITRKSDHQAKLQELYQFYWNNTLPLWPQFLRTTDQDQLKIISLDKRRKVISVPDAKTWEKLLLQFPMNLRNWKKVEKLPEVPLFKQPENSEIATLDYWGYWKKQSTTQPIPTAMAKFFHQTSRDIIHYPLYLRGKNSWKNRNPDDFKAEAGPMNQKGDQLWVQF